MNQYSSLKLSQFLHDKGFDKHSEMVYVDTRKSWKEYNCKLVKGKYEFIPFDGMDEDDPECELVPNKELLPNTGYNLSNPLKTYDLLWDLCLKHGKEIFGECRVCGHCAEMRFPESCLCDGEVEPNEYRWIYYSGIVFHLLQQGKTEEAEDVIMQNNIL